ncbi:MAG: tetratricopeptide repeat protein [Nitrospira sp.]|nr:tetratricopeptide repeat protein [Nitrospira sp.]
MFIDRACFQRGGIGCLLLVSLVAACGPKTVIRPPLPPSASDLTLLKSTTLCEHKADFLRTHGVRASLSHRWGSGQEVVIPQESSESRGNESYFFDEDNVLVGALFTFPQGLDLRPYPVLRDTLSRLRPVLEFYLAVAQLDTRSNFDTSAIYETGDEKSTTQYLVTGPPSRPMLLQASFAIDPYARLFSPYRREFLNRLRVAREEGSVQLLEGQGSEDKEPFLSLQQFARGQTAQLAYCGPKNYDVAADAYQKAIASGFRNKVLLAEAHHKLGLSWAAKGQLEQAKAELMQSLAIRPNVPEVLNNLGTVHSRLGEKMAALQAFERAVVLRPNYAVARFNLAEASEESNPRRALAEYETFLALAEGNPEEAARAAYARERIKALKQ